MTHGDEESPGKEGEKNDQKEIADALKYDTIRNAYVQLYHEAGLRGFVFRYNFFPFYNAKG
jgi:hypothetical protein